tara:strand:+ start:1088 stop:1312 length:225 start_codon:yes stop_codon:yes gene_type:complete
MIWKCKSDDCQTIFTYDNMKEMNYFVSNVTDYYMWPKYCIRDGAFIKDDGSTNLNSSLIVDGFGCHYDSYANMT